jgi:pimeloyl-ACP methyl ester carboxylesterase
MAGNRTVHIAAGGGVELAGDLTVPDAAFGLVVFAHGTGSSRHSRRNQAVAVTLRDRGLATLLLDLLTKCEEAVDLFSGELRFDIDLLADRVVTATVWAAEHAPTRALPVGYFGASTGAAAALVAAARQPTRVGAVVSRGGRPDLAESWLADVVAPTLLIVGERDETVIELNRRAYDKLRVERHLEIVPGAAHLLEEPGALEQVARLAGDWFTQHLRSTAEGPR